MESYAPMTKEQLIAKLTEAESRLSEAHLQIDALINMKQSNTEHKQSKGLFFKAFHTNPCMLAIMSLDDEKYIDVNENFIQAVGRCREEIIGHTSEAIGLWVSEIEKKIVRNCVLNQGQLRNYEMNYYTKSKEQRTALLSVDIITLGDQKCSLNVLLDITEKKRFESEIAHFDRLSIIGEMAASIGHEVRNPLTTVRGYLQLFQGRKQFSQYYEDLTTMIEELDRANLIISEFLSLAKNKNVELKRGNINAVLHTLFPLLQADAFRRGHMIHLETGPIPEIYFDSNELRQLVINLVRNGLEAMQTGGVVSIRTYFEDNTVILAIQDTGKGISEEVMGKLGTPFFTTKENGTGLGLPVCYRIVHRHNAKIDIQTSPMGTTFFIKFIIMENLKPTPAPAWDSDPLF